ncbi:MAG: lasso peptide isopeptide bond-forming cyclase [Actinomycetota bacterium]|nr:lasso peptide isopeptide bond-forming cyclase [Actinomycetota bacterium]
MLEFAAPPDLPFWFVVLPDGASAEPVAATVRARATHEISHPSGRPWLLGCWNDDALAVGQAGEVKIVVLGQHAATSGQLEAAAARTHSVADVDRLAGSLVGSVHLMASVGGRVRAQGTVTGLRRVFHATVSGTPVAADRADVVASLLGASLDERRLAVHLLSTSALYPLAGEPAWDGVGVLPSDHYLVLDGHGPWRSVKWWRPPEPVVPMAEGAPRLRDALAAAVDTRVRGRALVSCDLGGLDSTSVCCLASRGGPTVLAYTAGSRDPMAGDVAWARRTVAALRNVEHEVIAGDRLPAVYDGVLNVGERLDEPSAAAVCLDRYLVIARSAASRGSPLHLTGFGGDELLAGSPAHLHALVRTQPKIALRNARGFAAQRPWPYRETLRQLFGSRPYQAWLAEAANQLTAPPPRPDMPTLDWGSPPRMPPWATPAAVAAVRELIVDAARTVEPLAAGRGQHVELEAMRSTSRMVRHLAQMAGRAGVALAAPYYDDRVIEVGLSVRAQERVTPWQYKPLIVEAMRGTVPNEILTRRTKDEGSYEVETGLREHRGDLLALWEGSRLARLGLVDGDALREMCRGPLPPSLPYDALFQTVACEVWLRTLQPALVPAGVEGE